jgi:hypothetical protein
MPLRVLSNCIYYARVRGLYACTFREVMVVNEFGCLRFFGLPGFFGLTIF